jgi:hypothetical protein
MIYEDRRGNVPFMMKLVEESSGMGNLMWNEAALCEVRYQLSRFQGVAEGSGLPIPGLHRFEGSVKFNAGTDVQKWIGAPLKLRLEDGRAIAITLLDSAGRFLNEGHGPSRCFCC